MIDFSRPIVLRCFDSGNSSSKTEQPVTSTTGAESPNQGDQSAGAIVGAGSIGLGGGAEYQEEGATDLSSSKNDTIAGTDLAGAKNVTIETDDGAVSDALGSLQGNLSGTQALLANAQNSLVDATANTDQAYSNAQTEAEQTNATTSGGILSSLTAWLQTLTPTQIALGIGGVVAALFLIIGLPVILSKKK